MNDLDKDLRHTLHALADSVPESHDAKGDFERRIARRRGAHRPLLVAAAAALVAAFAVTIPLTVTRDDVPPAAEQEKTDGLMWTPDYKWMAAEAGPYVVGSFVEDGKNVDAVVWVRGGELCLAEGHRVPVGESTDRPPAALTGTRCETLPVSWPTGPQGMDHLITRPVLAEEGILHSGPVPGLMLFVTDPRITELVARAGDGSPVPVRELGETGGMRLFLADFGATSAGFGYTAFDAAGYVVVNAIT